MGQLGDIRFDGFSNGQLADQVNKLKQGQGAAALQPVIDTLHGVAQDLAATNDILHTQLGKLGIDWHSVAGQGASNTMNSTVNYGDDSQYNITGTNNALTTQADSHTVAQSAPAPSSDSSRPFCSPTTERYGITV